MLTELYTPSQLEREAIRPIPGNLKLSGDGIFATNQGEGVTAGAKAVFVRLHFCNLACGRDGGWKCDTWYTWDKRTKEFWQEAKDTTPETLAQMIAASWSEKFGQAGDNRIVVTGGEPLLQQNGIVQLVRELPGWKVEIETNGTIPPLAELGSCQFNCSPKLQNSGNSLVRRYRPRAITKILEMPNSWFKFVAASVDDLEEVEFIVDDCRIPKDRVLIMPEGNTLDAVNLHKKMLQQDVDRLGWRITDRHQLEWFGNARRT